MSYPFVAGLKTVLENDPVVRFAEGRSCKESKTEASELPAKRDPLTHYSTMSTPTNSVRGNQVRSKVANEPVKHRSAPVLQVQLLKRNTHLYTRRGFAKETG